MGEISLPYLKGEKVDDFTNVALDSTVSNFNTDMEAINKAFNAEILADIESMSDLDTSTQEYTNAVNNLQTMVDTHREWTEMHCEVARAYSEVSKHEEKKPIDWSVVAPKAIGAAVYGVVMIMFIAMEREHPPAMRLIQAANALISPKL